MKRLTYFIIITFMLGPVRAQKTDKVYLANGDILTGEIKGMSLAILSFNMDGPGTINIKWEHVVSVKSNRVFEIMFSWGELVVAAPDSLFFARYMVKIDDIIEMTTIKAKVFARLSGDLNIGFNFTKSNQALQSNWASTFTYRVPKLEINLVANSVINSRSDDSVVTRKQDVSLNCAKYLSRHIVLSTELAWQENTELGLANRYLFNGGVGKALISDNHNRLLAAGGISTNAEQSLESKTYTWNLDGLVTVQYKKFYYSAPKLSIDGSCNVYPGLSNWGRIRVEFSVKTSVEVYTDLVIGLNFYDNFDNRPPEGASSKNDYGINFTVGYVFGK